MNTQKTTKMAQELLQKHGCGDVPVKICSSKRIIAYVNFRTNRYTGNVIKELYISKWFIPNLDEQEMRETILHEIAHIKAGPKVGHGYAWKVECLKLGIGPKATTTVKNKENIEATANYIGVCPKCNRKFYKYRGGKRVINSVWQCRCGGKFQYKHKSEV